MEEESIEFCVKDYKNRHFWERIGIFKTTNGKNYILHQCSQCRKCKLEKIKIVKRHDFEEDD